jgi:hypothetical protein
MGIRETIQDKPAAGIVVVVVVVLGIVAFNAARFSDHAEPGSRFYLNVDTGEIEVFNAQSSLPPVKLPSGSNGVLAHVFACGDCDGGEQFVVFLEKYTDEYRQAATAEVSDNMAPITTPVVGHHVAILPEDGADIRWVEMTSAEGARVARHGIERCDNRSGRPTECLP